MNGETKRQIAGVRTEAASGTRGCQTTAITKMQVPRIVSLMCTIAYIEDDV
jgi:hypothetical protein